MPITGEQIVQSAQKYTGVPYFEGNPQSTQGMDCSGIVQQALADLGVNVSRTTYSQLSDADNHTGPGVDIGTDLSQAQPGDVIHYNEAGGGTNSHEEIYLGGGMVFSEAYPGTSAAVRGMDTSPIAAIVRYADAGPGATTTTGPTATNTPNQPGSAGTGVAAVALGLAPRLGLILLGAGFILIGLLATFHHQSVTGHLVKAAAVA